MAGFARLGERWRAIARTEPVTVALLVGANQVPLLGVLFLGWDVFLLLFLYWVENGVVGLINAPKILLAGRNPQVHESAALAVARSIFFLIHYGAFWLAHGVFVFVLAFAFGSGVAIDDPALVLAVATLAAGHLAAFLFNYVRRREFLQTTPPEQAWQPYTRLIVLHLTIIFGAVAIAVLGQPSALVGLLVLIKIALDLGLHARERTRIQRTATAPATV